MIQNAQLPFFEDVAQGFSFSLCAVFYLLLNRAVKINATKSHSYGIAVIFASIGVFLSIFLVVSDLLAALPLSHGSLALYSILTLIVSVLISILASIKISNAGLLIPERKPGKNTKKESIAGMLGLSRERLTLQLVLLGVVIFIIIFLFEVAISLISIATNVKINTNVGSVFSGAPFWFIIFLAVIEPINEEVLFRGLMVPRIGIVFSSLLFAAGHVSYNSTFGIEVIFAFVFGIIASYMFRKTKSLYPSITAHILVNTLAAISLLH
ncbi:MAG: CPBP family intramembrane metalloprotease [Candidatus Marsarchaeota archaeon]|nr:CPBP family intramembrane metalloprotease [Candidatus Marsarchaeota archaeon]